jgi:hypothetical protein
MPSRKARRLTKAGLQAAGATPGLMTTRYAPDGERAEIRQLSPEGPDRRRDFVRRLSTDENAQASSEGSGIASNG